MLPDVLLGNLPIAIMTAFLYVYIAQKILQCRIPFKKYLIYCLLIGIIHAFVLSILTFQDIEKYSNIRYSYILIKFGISSLYTYALHKIFPHVSLSYCLYLCLLCTLLEQIGNSIVFTFFFDSIRSLPLPRLLPPILSSLSSLLIGCILFHLLKQTRLMHAIQQLMESSRRNVFAIITYFVLDIFVYLLGVQFKFNHLQVYWMLTSAIIVAVFTTYANAILQKEKLHKSSLLLLQQQEHIQNLENIQKELRMIQHDYKNLINGLYLRAQEQDFQGIQEYIQQRLLHVDDHIQKDVQYINALVKIEVLELKSIITTKALLAKQQNISFEIEVLHTIDYVPMKIEDLVRCVGILLDNAIEEVSTQENGYIKIVLLKEENKFSLLIKNTISNPLDISKIYQQGYSTKGQNRGLGLLNYQTIISNYDNAFKETKVDNQEFMQTLTLVSSI